MKKLSTTLAISLVALIAVGCNNTDTTVETPPSPETTPAAQGTVLAGSEGAGNYNDIPENLNELDNPESLETIIKDITPIETSEQAVTEVDEIVAELDAIDEELAALDDLLNDL